MMARAALCEGKDADGCRERLHTQTPLHPGFLVKEEMSYLGWNQADLAEVLGRPRQFVNRLVNGKVGISAKTARELAACFPDHSALDWLKAWRHYELAIYEKDADAD